MTRSDEWGYTSYGGTWTWWTDRKIVPRYLHFQVHEREAWLAYLDEIVERVRENA